MSTLLRGSRDVDAVLALQHLLRDLGYEVPMDGVFGLDTDAAVRMIQRRQGLDPDGIVGPLTRNALAVTAPAVPVPLRPVRVQPLTPYRSQRDNMHGPSSTCNVTSYAMLLHALGVRDPQGKQLEDALYEAIVSPAGAAEFRRGSPSLVGKVAPQTVHAMLVWVAAQFGRRTRFTTLARWSEVVDSVTAGKPVVLAGKFTSSGHIVCVVGLAGPRDLICHDPWGDWNRKYRDHDGEARIYSMDALGKITDGDGGLWALFVA